MLKVVHCTECNRMQYLVRSEGFCRCMGWAAAIADRSLDMADGTECIGERSRMGGRLLQAVPFDALFDFQNFDHNR